LKADEKKCPQCAETIKAEAKICRFCGHSFENDISPNLGSLPPDNGKKRGKGCLTVLAVLIALVVVIALVGPGKQTAPSASTAAGENASGDSEASGAPSSVGLFGPRANAARSAQQYLAMTGFSRQGLIQQLSSDAGNGYSVADATAAVDSLTVDWNEQAARSAKQYLSISGFSCSGLVEQLSSDAGSKYTKAQARYGAQQAGAC
jgi:hypothetical protein